MNSHRLAEEEYKLIEAHIKAHIAARLAELRTDRADAKVTTEPPQSYFKYPRAKGYKTPAVFIIVDRINFRQTEKGANHINALSRVNVSVLIEDRDRDSLTVKAWRYQSVLHALLEQTILTSQDSKVKLAVRVTSADFGSLYTNTDNEENPQSVFRKEVVLECDVEHFENF